MAAEGPWGPLGQLARWSKDWLSGLPVVGGLVDRLDLPSFAAILLAALVVAASAMLLGRLWSVWDSNDVDRFFLPAKRLGRWRTHWPSWAFLGLTGSLVLGIMATVAAYAGGAWLLLVPLAVSLLLTAALVWVRWRTCLDERDDRRPAVAAHPQLDSAKAG